MPTATSATATCSTATRLGYKRNIFGGTFGGPIKRDKAFFFVDYEGTEQRTGGPSSASVAPQAWRNGDLSAVPQHHHRPDDRTRPSRASRFLSRAS